MEKKSLMYTKNILLILLAWILVLPLKAQNNWTLLECIAYAMEHNLEQQVYVLNERSARIEHSRSKFSLLPSVSASADAGLNFGRSVDPNTNDYVDTEFFNSSMDFGASIALFEGFIRLNRIAYTRFRLEAARWQKINDRDELAFEVLMAFYDAEYSAGLVRIAREQLELSEQNLKRTGILVEEGLKARTDLAEMQASCEKERMELIRAENREEEVLLELRQILNLPSGKLTGIRPEPDRLSGIRDLKAEPDSLFVSFVRFSPYVRMAGAELNAAGKQVAMARGGFFPSICLEAGLGTGFYETNKDDDGGTTSFRNQMDNNLNQYLGATLSIPLFGRNEIRAELKQARLAREEAEIRLEQYRQAVYYELANNSRELKSLFREYVQSCRQAETEKLAWEVAGRKYEEGLIDVIEMLAVKSRLAESQSQLLLSGLQWQIKYRLLEFYRGIRFWETGEAGCQDIRVP
ncbi:MAG: TolC family protein [Mangrovibacterium sp.]